VIIIVGIPLLWYLVKSLREYRIEMLIKTGVDKLSTDVDALLQVNKMTEFS
jgi:PAS domain S-box-containing protein